MPIDAVEAILKYRTDVVIDIYTLKTPKKFSNEYLNFKEKNFNHQNLNIVELEVPKDYYYIYNTEAGEDRNRWDLESLMFNRMVQIHLLEKNYNFTLSFYLLDGFIIPISSTIQTKNILYLLGYPKEFNEMRIPILKMYDKLLANSLNVKEKWQSLANNQFDNCQILHQGTELELDPANLNLGKNHNIVFAGRIMERKGIGTLINAIKLIKNKIPNIKLHVLGDGVYLEKLKDIVNNDNELNGLVEFYGHVSNVRSFFKSADVCIFPSWEKEGLMSTAIEAMYYNGLVITTKGNGNEDFIIDNKNGFLIETKSEKVIADKIIELYYLQYENQNIIKDIKVNAKETIINNFIWKKFVNSLFEVIDIT